MTEPDGSVIDRFYGAPASGHLADALGCLTPDARVWHCFDGIAHDRDSSLEGWKALLAAFPQRAFVDVRRHPIPGGFVQQQMMTGCSVSGALVAWPVCVVIMLQDGQISRIDEYIDRAGKFTITDLHSDTTPGL